jgi:hypothetical protein
MWVGRDKLLPYRLLRIAIAWRTPVEQRPPIFPQFAGGIHGLFTIESWGKGEWPALYVVYLSEVSGAAAQD